MSMINIQCSLALRKCPGSVYLVILGSWDKEDREGQSSQGSMPGHETLNSDKHQVTKLFGQNHDLLLSYNEKLLFIILLSLLLSQARSAFHLSKMSSSPSLSCENSSLGIAGDR